MDYFKDKIEEGRRVKQEKVNTKKYIYLGELPPNVDKYSLYTFIQEQAPKDSSQKMEIEDLMIRGKDKPFAYVKFKTRESAETALKVLHLKTFQNHILKAEAFKSSKKDQKKLNTNLFVKNLPKDTKPKELFDIFVQYGEIDSINLKTNNTTGECLGYGYINFTTEESAKTAIEKLNQSKFKDSTISVSLFTPREKRLENMSIPGEYMEPLLIVKNVPEEIDDKKFKNQFDIYGQIIISGVLSDQPTNLNLNIEKKESSDLFAEAENDIKKAIEDDDKSVGASMSINGDNSSVIGGGNRNYGNRYGVILYSSKEDAKASMNQMKEKYEMELIPYDIDLIEQIKKKKHDNMKEKYSGSNLIVKDLPKEIDDKMFLNIFKQFGDIASARVQVQGNMKEIKDENGNLVDKKYIYESKGFGFVLFKKAEDAQRARETLNEKEFEFEGKKLKLLIENYDYDKGEKNRFEQFQREMGMIKRGFPQRGRGEFPRVRGRGRGRGRGDFNGPNNFPLMGMNQNNMNQPMNNMGQQFNNMNQINQQQMNNFGPQKKIVQKIPGPIVEPKIYQEDKITVEGEKLVEKIQEKLLIEQPEERTEAIGEVLFFFLLKFIEQYNLNDSETNSDDSSLCSKLTGILIRTDTKNLINIISSTERLYNSLKDVVNKLKANNNNGREEN